MMLNNEKLTFRVSAGLKNIIGKELITDQYIAIFELVKNAFDAHAKKVTIIFENIYKQNERIIMIDDGKGMDLNDINNKWLFVAYSAKKDGTEEIEENDYRGKIRSKRIFAGAKGVGRFSCDRLGSKLNMTTLKDKEGSDIECIEVDWDDFEKDAKEEFVNISIKHITNANNSYGINNGTVLEISNLRDSWDRHKLLLLKRSLEKLINPNQNIDIDDFTIEIIALDELDKDKLQKEQRDKVNGIIKNYLFETLDLKTTQIITEIIEDGEFINTILIDRGKLIYQIKEINHYFISNVKIHLFQLNRAAKVNFKKIMGITSVSYGSVFMYKNGFRIYPFGEEGEDTLGIDRRKAQRHSSYLGTRDLMGRIEISGDSDDFKETTSRDGGLIKNQSYNELVALFYEKALRRLEKYVVDIIKWGDPYRINPNDETLQPELTPEDVKTQIIEIIANLTKSKEIIDVKYDKDFLKIIDEHQSKSAASVFKNVTRIAEKTNDPILLKEALKAERHLKQILDERREIHKEIENKDAVIDKTSRELEQVNSQNLFLKSVTSYDKKELVSLQHQIDHGTERIKTNLRRLASAINNDIPKSELLKYIENISLENDKISTIARFVTKANFNLMSQYITKDLVQFVNEYIENVYKEYAYLRINNQLLNVQVFTPKHLKYECKFRPLEIIIVVDNLFNNSNKAGAKNVFITWSVLNTNRVQLKFKDDGHGIPTSILNKIFDFGFTTTDGSGLGLYHVKQIVEKMGGSITVNSEFAKGVEFILEVER